MQINALIKQSIGLLLLKDFAKLQNDTFCFLIAASECSKVILGGSGGEWCNHTVAIVKSLHVVIVWFKKKFSVKYRSL